MAHPERRSSPSAVEFDVPESFGDIPEVALAPPIPFRDVDPGEGGQDIEPARQSATRSSGHHSSPTALEFDAPESFEDIPEVALAPPIPLRNLDPEDARRDGAAGAPETEPPEEEEVKVSRFATEIYTISYLILFAIFGALARIGLQALTLYPGAPVIFSSVWPNFGGSLVMGFLSEDRMLFRHEWGVARFHQHVLRIRRRMADEERGGPRSSRHAAELAAEFAAAKKAHMAAKKTIPLYIGLATGFCGSFTSFSSFIRDLFLAASNDLPTPDVSPDIMSRNGGYSFMAFLAVLIGTVGLSLSGLFIGSHLAIALEPFTPSFPFQLTRRVIDPLAVFLGWGCWIGAILLSILPPDRFSHPGAAETWRGRATFSIVFAPLGCLLRFYVSMHLNPLIASFPLGTFSVNIFGTAVLGMSWDLAHVPLGGVVGCQVLQGIEDGFCGALTTVSTWVTELASLKRGRAYIYGATSTIVAFAIMVAIMGGLRWSEGFEPIVCLK